jgi:hypothetical protein
MPEPIEIPLQCWCDPQGDSLLIYTAKECSIYRGCWVASAEPADYICHLAFHDVSAVRSYPREFVPYQRTPTHHSSLLCILDSDLIQEHIAYRQRHYPSSVRDTLRLRHYIVSGHDFYLDILATGFTEATIPHSQIADERLLQFIRNA